MSHTENENFHDELSSTESAVTREDPLADASQVISHAVPPGVDRRTFMMRGAVVAATAVITGRSISAQEKTARSTAAAPAAPPLSPDLNVVQKGKGPVMTTI